MLSVKHVYDAPSPDDGFRILTDRLWPRGLSKERAKVDLWAKNIAPSTELRKWFSHDPEKWAEFKKRYHAELRDNREAVDEVRRIIHQHHNKVTLLFGAKDAVHNQAAVLAETLDHAPAPAHSS